MTTDVYGPLPIVIFDLVRAVAAHQDRGHSAVLLDQAQHAVVSAETPGRSADLIVSPQVERSTLADGPVHPAPSVLSATGQVLGEVLLWVRDGYLIGVERTWYTDDAPDAWPEVTSLDFA